MSAFSRMLFWNSIIRSHQKDRELYEAIKAETELAPHSKKLGVKSLTFSLIYLLVVGACVGGIYLLISVMDDHVFWGILGLIAIALILFSTTFKIYIRAFRLLIYQFKVNRTAISWVALAFIILPTLVVIGVIIILVAGGLNK